MGSERVEAVRTHAGHTLPSVKHDNMRACAAYADICRTNVDLVERANKRGTTTETESIRGIERETVFEKREKLFWQT